MNENIKRSDLHSSRLSKTRFSSDVNDGWQSKTCVPLDNDDGCWLSRTRFSPDETTFSTHTNGSCLSKTCFPPRETIFSLDANNCWLFETRFSPDADGWELPETCFSAHDDGCPQGIEPSTLFVAVCCSRTFKDRAPARVVVAANDDFAVETGGHVSLLTSNTHSRPVRSRHVWRNFSRSLVEMNL